MTKKTTPKDHLISLRISDDLFKWINKQDMSKSEVIRFCLQRIKENGDLDNWKKELREAMNLIDSIDTGSNNKIEHLKVNAANRLKRLKAGQVDFTDLNTRQHLKAFLQRLEQYGLVDELDAIIKQLKELAKK